MKGLKKMENTNNKEIKKKSHKGLLIFLGLFLIGGIYLYNSNSTFSNLINVQIKQEETYTTFEKDTENSTYSVSNETIVLKSDGNYIYLETTIDYDYIYIYVQFFNGSNEAITTKQNNLTSVTKDTSYSINLYETLTITELFTIQSYQVTKIICKKS
jgi:hypothetical protein